MLGTTTFSRINVDCVFFESMRNRTFLLLERLSEYLATAIIRSVFRTLLNLMELFVKTGNGF